MDGEAMTNGTRNALVWNIQRRAEQVSTTDPAVFARFHDQALSELDYHLESAGDAIERATSGEQDAV